MDVDEALTPPLSAQNVMMNGPVNDEGTERGPVRRERRLDLHPVRRLDYDEVAIDMTQEVFADEDVIHLNLYTDARPENFLYRVTSRIWDIGQALAQAVRNNAGTLMNLIADFTYIADHVRINREALRELATRLDNLERGRPH